MADDEATQEKYDLLAKKAELEAQLELVKARLEKAIFAKTKGEDTEEA